MNKLDQILRELYLKKVSDGNLLFWLRVFCEEQCGNDKYSLFSGVTSSDV